MIAMKLPNYLFAFLFLALLGLTACDSGNEDDDDVVETEIIETITETTVSASDPIVSSTNNTIASSFQAEVGAGVVVSTAAGAVTKTTSSSTSGGQTTTTSTTIAPLVNASTGQPTGQVAIITQSGSSTTTRVAGMASTSTSSPTLGITSQDGTKVSVPFDASFNARPATVQGNNSAAKEETAAYNALLAAVPTLTADFKFSNGKTAKQSFIDALALPGKQGGIQHLVPVIIHFTSRVYASESAALVSTAVECAFSFGASSVGTVQARYAVGGINMILTRNCATNAVTRTRA